MRRASFDRGFDAGWPGRGNFGVTPAAIRECHAGMKTAIKLEPMDVNSIPFQEASLDIWDKKYRLSAKDGTPIDRSMDETYKRVARALADVEREEVREH